MNITKITNVQLINQFFSNIIDIVNDDNDMIRHNTDYELKSFTTCNIDVMIKCLTNEPYMYSIDEDIDLLIVTNTRDELLFTIDGKDLEF